MSRSLVALDRFAALVFGLALATLGVGAILWWSGDLPFADPRLNISPFGNLDSHSWWSQSVGAGGVVLSLLALRWLLAPLKRASVKRLVLAGGSKRGRLDLDANALVDAAANAFEETLGVRSATGRTHRERKTLVAVITAKIEPTASLVQLASAGDAIAQTLVVATGRPDIHCRIHLSVVGRGRTLSRVD